MKLSTLFVGSLLVASLGAQAETGSLVMEDSKTHQRTVYQIHSNDSVALECELLIEKIVTSQTEANFSCLGKQGELKYMDVYSEDFFHTRMSAKEVKEARE